MACDADARRPCTSGLPSPAVVMSDYREAWSPSSPPIMHPAEWKQRHQGHRVERQELGPVEDVGPHRGISGSAPRGAPNPKVDIVIYCYDCEEQFLIDQAAYNPDDWPPLRSR